MTKEDIKRKITGFINPQEYIHINDLTDKISAKKIKKYALKVIHYRQCLVNLFTNNKEYGEMIFKLLELEHFMFIYNNVLSLDTINNIKKRPKYCRDYRTSEELTAEMITASVDEAFTIIDLRMNGKDTHFNPLATHTADGELNGEPDLVVYKNGGEIYLEQQTVVKPNKIIVLKYAKYKKIREAVANGKTVYLLTKYIDLATNKVKYNFILMNDIIKNKSYSYVHNPKEEDIYYKQWFAFGKKAIVILDTPPILYKSL